MKSICSECGYPMWSWRHYPNHPSNLGYENITHAYVIPELVVPTEERQLPPVVYGGVGLLKDMVLVAIVVLPIMSITALIERVLP